MTEFWIAQPTQ